MTIELSQDEIARITRKVKPSAQSKVLTALGIPHKPRPDGSLVVSRLAYELVMGGVTAQQAKRAAEQEPDFGALYGT